MRSLIFKLFFYGFTLVMAVVCYIVARTSTRDRLWQAIGFWGKTLVGAVRLILDARIETATMRLIREHAQGEVLAAAEGRHARGAANED